LATFFAEIFNFFLGSFQGFCQTCLDFKGYTGLQLRVIGEYFGIGESGVCQASRRLDLKMKGDSGLQKKVDKIKGKLWLSRMNGLLPKQKSL